MIERGEVNVSVRTAFKLARGLGISLSVLFRELEQDAKLTGGSFKRLLYRVGLPEKIRLPDLRHTCATLLLSEGTHPKIVQELLGHATISITLDTYSHVLPTMQDQAVAAMESALP